MKNIDVSVIYVNYNSTQSLLESIKSVNENTKNCKYEIIVVDNNSDENLEKLEKENIFLIKNKTNFGFAKACNIGAKNSRGKYLLFLNPDTILKGNCLYAMKDFLEKNKNAGACGCITIEGDRGNLKGGSRKFHTIFTEIIERLNLGEKFLNYSKTGEVDALIGACIMVSKKIFNEIEGFDENFFLYYEDIDLCKKIKNKGYKIYLLDTCTLYHQGGESTGKEFKDEFKLMKINLQSAYYYFKKNHGNIYAEIWKKTVKLIYYLKFLLKRDNRYLELAKWNIKN